MPLPTVIALIALALGFGLQSQGRLPDRVKSWIAQGLIQVLYPSLIFSALLLRLNKDSLSALWVLPFLVAMTLLLGLFAGLALENKLGLSQDSQKRSFRFLCLLPNYSYLPLMVAQALWGDYGITLVAIAGVGADLVLWTIGVPQIMVNRRFEARRLLLNPPLIALVMALLLLQTDFASLRTVIHPILEPLRSLGSATIPVSMLLLGAHLGRPTRGGKFNKAHGALLMLRLLLIPGALTLLFTFFPSLLAPLPRQVLILIASMPGAIIAVVLSEIHGASPNFAARHILLGHGLWLLTGPLWLWLNFHLG